MDLTQKKLSKSEWNNIEVPFPEDEKNILKMIINGFQNTDIKDNNSTSLLSIMKLDPNTNGLEVYLFQKYFENTIKNLVKTYSSIIGEYNNRSLEKDQKTLFVRTPKKSVKVKFFVNLRKSNECILKLEKNKFEPPVPCFAPEVNTYPPVSQERPNCYIGGWAWENTHFSSGWSLMTEHVQQVDHANCQAGLGTSIKETELCAVGTGVLPEPSVELCGVFTGMPMVCFDEREMATVHAIAAWPVGCAIPGVNVGVWSQITSRSIHKLFFEVERYKQARKDFYENIQLKSTGEIDIGS